MSWVLGIDTSSIDLGVALFKDETAVSSYSRFIRNSHAEHISQIVRMILEANSVDPFEIANVAVSTGPGSFTGLRIGIAFAKGFCIGRNALICPVSSLMVLAHAGRRYNGRVLSAIDARNGDVFWAPFMISGGRVERSGDDQACSVEVFRNQVTVNDTVITDTMGYSRSTVFSFLEENPRWFPVERFPIQRGLYCASIGASVLDEPSMWKEGSEILPNYLRQSSAQKKAGKTA